MPIYMVGMNVLTEVKGKTMTLKQAKRVQRNTNAARLKARRRNAMRVAPLKLDQEIKKHYWLKVQADKKA